MTTRAQNLKSLKNEQVLKKLVFPEYGFEGALVGKIKDGKRIAGIRVTKAGYWDILPGLYNIDFNDASKLVKMKGDELSSNVLAQLI